jgi:membrane-associated phospholipid phosphatase
VERRAALSPTRPPAALTRISALARGGRLWFAIAALLATRSPTTRRAARDGVAALLLASSCAQVLNRVVSRPRPAAGHLPARDALVHQPRTPSFPSSHSAVAAAFTTAAGRRSPITGMMLVPWQPPSPTPVSAPEPTGRPTSLPGSPSEPSSVNWFTATPPPDDDGTAGHVRPGRPWR